MVGAASRIAGDALTDSQDALGKALLKNPRPRHTYRKPEWGFGERLWSIEELALIGSGMTSGEIATATGRTQMAVEQQMFRVKKQRGQVGMPRKGRRDVGTWWMQAACRNHPQPDLFFPCLITKKTGRDTAKVGDTEETLAAKATCADCPVKTECLESILSYEQNADRNQRYGIWGGTTPQERARLARERQRGIERLSI